MKNRIIKVLVFFLPFIIQEPHIWAQPAYINYQQVGDLENYSSSSTQNIFQDSRGLIWIGTAMGLDCWDGGHIISYPYSASDSMGIPGGNIVSIAEDDHNNLWLGSPNYGLIKFDLEEESFALIDHQSSPVTNIYCVKYDPSGFLWLGTGEGLFRYYPESDSIDPVWDGEVFSTGKVKQAQVNALEYDKSGVLWMVAARTLYYFNEEKGSIIPKRFMTSVLQGDRLFSIMDLSIGEDGILWMIRYRDNSELVRFDPYADVLNFSQLTRDEYSTPIYPSILVDKQGNVLLGKANGLLIYDQGMRLLQHLESQEHMGDVSDIFEDSRGNIFLATTEGVKLLDKKSTEIRKYTFCRDYLSLYPNSRINQVIRNDKYFWVGTQWAGVIRYDTETRIQQHYHLDDRDNTPLNDNIHSMHIDRGGGIWVANGENKLNKYDSVSDRFKLVDLKKNTVQLLIEDKKGFFWFLDYNNVIRLDPVAMDVVAFPLKVELPPNFFLPLDPNSRTMDNDGILWLGHDEGLFRIDPVKGDLTYYSMGRDNPAGLPDHPIMSLCCDSKNRIWLGTEVGLGRLVTHQDSDSIAFMSITSESDRIRFVSRIIEDGSGNIWFNSDFGIYVMKTDGTIEHYTDKDGLPGDPKNISALDVDSVGNILAGAIDFVALSPEFLVPNKIAPPVIITEFNVSGKRVIPGKGLPLEKSILFSDWIDLRYDQNFIRIDFSALNYTDPYRNRYCYILEGIDKDTVWSGDKNFAEYSNLAPGKYKFWVSGSNNSGIWNQDGTSIMVNIHPPWYSSNLAIVLYSLTILLMIFSFIKFRTERLRKEKVFLEKEVENRTIEIREKNEQIRELDQIKTRFFTNISHEFRSLITLIRSPVEEVIDNERLSKRSRGNLELVRRNANKLMKLVNQLLDISKIDERNMSLALIEDNIFDFAHSLAISFSSLAESRGITYRFHLPTSDKKVWFDPDKLEKIISNLLSNAFKFTKEGGKVVMEIKQEADHKSKFEMIKIIVSDNGPGIPEEEQNKIFDRFYQAEAHLRKEGGGTGIGLALTRDLVQLMHGSITVKSQVGKGSSFIVEIPVGKDHLNENEFTIIESLEKAERGSMEDAQMLDSKKRERIRDDGQLKSKTREIPQLLVVEDNADIRAMIAENLGNEFEVIEAIDGSAGFRLSIDYEPDLVITDLMMPRMDGTELCERLKADLRTSHIPVIMLTAKATLEDKLKGLETGADDYIPKPFDIKEVRIRAKNLIDQRRILREKFGKEITLDPVDVVITPVDEKFLTRAMDVVETHMGEASFDISTFGDEMNMSRSTLFRKLEALTNMSPVEFITNMRLKRAATLLKQHYGNVSEVALEVGFSNPSYFTQVFKKAFSVTPAQYAKS